MTTTGYGQDTWCLDELCPGRIARGRTALAQAIYRRLTTTRGTLRGGPDESRYGLDVPSYVGAVGTRLAIAALPTLIRAELLKDDRILSARVSAYLAGEDVAIVVDVTPHDEGQAFALTLSASTDGLDVVGGLP